MKKINKTLLWVTLSFLLISCKGQRPERLIYGYLDSTEPITLWGRSIELTYQSTWKNHVDSLYTEIMGMVEKGKATSVSLFSKVNELYSISWDYSQAQSEADLYSSMYCRTEDYELENLIRSEYSDASYKMNEVEKAIVKSSKYRDSYIKAYHPGLEGEALDRFIKECENPSKPEVLETQKAMSTLQTKFRSGIINSYEFYHEFVPIANGFAREKGFDNYLEYTYKNMYGREYTVSDISRFAENTVHYVMDAERAIDAKFENNHYSDSAISFEQSIRRDFLGPYLKEFERYAAFIGGSFNRNYNNLLDKGNYFFSSVPNSKYTAYSTSSVSIGSYLFFSRNYQDIGTFVHEFGHYNAGFESDAYSFDIFETQSQGDELLFLYYMTEESDKKFDWCDSEWTDLHKYMVVKDFLRSVRNCTWVNECEEYIYTHEGITEEEMLNMVNETAAKYNLKTDHDDFSHSYVGYVGPENPGYYISYAVSAMASLSLYALACNEGFYKAAKAYEKVYSIGSVSFQDMIETANLYDPLTDEGFQSIATALTTIN